MKCKTYLTTTKIMCKIFFVLSKFHDTVLYLKDKAAFFLEILKIAQINISDEFETY